jgi:hypothetical protein
MQNFHKINIKKNNIKLYLFNIIMYNFIVAMFFWLGNLLTDIIIFKKRHINPKIQTYIIEPVRRCFNLDYKRFNVVKQNNIIKKYDNNEEITNLVYDFIIEKNNLDI